MNYKAGLTDYCSRRDKRLFSERNGYSLRIRNTGFYKTSAGNMVFVNTVTDNCAYGVGINELFVSKWALDGKFVKEGLSGFDIVELIRIVDEGDFDVRK